MNDRLVSTDEGQKYANTNNMDFYETSAKNETHISECFSDIIKRIINEHDFVDDINHYYNPENTFESKSKCCIIF